MPTRRRTTFVSGNRRLAGSATHRRQFVLEVKARRTTAVKYRRRRIARWVFLILFWACFAAAFAFSTQAVLEKFFFSNPDYRLARLEFDGGAALTIEEISRLTGIRPGMNLFRIDLGLAEKRMETIPEILDARVRRELPDAILISAEFRNPVAWVLGDAAPGPPHLLVDASGHVYQPHRVLPDQFSLPVIAGVNLELLEEEDPLHRQDLGEAIALLQTLRHTPESTLDLRAIDISKGYCLVVREASGAEILFPTGEYPAQLARLQKLLDHCSETGRELEMVNLIPKRTTPVRFALAEVPRAEPVGPRP